MDTLFFFSTICTVAFITLLLFIVVLYLWFLHAVGAISQSQLRLRSNKTFGIVAFLGRKCNYDLVQCNHSGSGQRRCHHCQRRRIGGNRRGFFDFDRLDVHGRFAALGPGNISVLATVATIPVRDNVVWAAGCNIIFAARGMNVGSDTRASGEGSAFPIRICRGNPNEGREDQNGGGLEGKHDVGNRRKKRIVYLCLLLLLFLFYGTTLGLRRDSEAKSEIAWKEQQLHDVVLFRKIAWNIGVTKSFSPANAKTCNKGTCDK